MSERVYRAMLARPESGVAELADALGVTEAEIREALDQLFELSLIRASVDRPDALHAISPEVGLQQALAQQQADLAKRQQHVVECQTAVMQLIEDFGATRKDTGGSAVRSIIGMDAVRDKLDQLGREAQEEILTLMPGGAQSPAALEHAQRNDLPLLRRGVRLRGIGLDSLRNDATTLAHVQFLTDNGGEFRTSPTLPLRMILADRRTALVPIDPHNSRRGVLELTGSGIVMPMLALFEQIWGMATPFGAAHDPDRVGLTHQEQALLGLLAQGLTDETVNHRGRHGRRAYHPFRLTLTITSSPKASPEPSWNCPPASSYGLSRSIYLTATLCDSLHDQVAGNPQRCTDRADGRS